jgi:manganese transport system permease protein
VARTLGIPTGMLLGMLILLIVLAMVSSLQAVGVLLSLGLLILPAATIYLLSDSFDAMVWGGAALGTSGAVAGLLLSFWANIPSGPAIVLILGAVFLGAYLFGPRYGVISRAFKRRHLHEESLERWSHK